MYNKNCRILRNQIILAFIFLNFIPFSAILMNPVKNLFMLCYVMSDNFFCQLWESSHDMINGLFFSVLISVSSESWRKSWVDQSLDIFFLLLPLVFTWLTSRDSSYRSLNGKINIPPSSMSNSDDTIIAGHLKKGMGYVQ